MLKTEEFERTVIFDGDQDKPAKEEAKSESHIMRAPPDDDDDSAGEDPMYPARENAAYENHVKYMIADHRGDQDNGIWHDQYDESAHRMMVAQENAPLENAFEKLGKFLEKEMDPKLKNRLAQHLMEIVSSLDDKNNRPGLGSERVEKLNL